MAMTDPEPETLWAQRGFLPGARINPNPDGSEVWFPIIWHLPSGRFLWFGRAAFARYWQARESAVNVLTRNSIAGRLDVMLGDMAVVGL